MIAYLEGQLLKKDDDRIILLVQHVGYEILLPAFVKATIEEKQAGDPLAFFIYYHQTERQPKPVLIGFNEETEKDFFQYFISVDALGPLKAAKALTLPIGELAEAIESGKLSDLKKMKGIGERTAQKIIATLRGKVTKFVVFPANQNVDSAPANDLIQPVLDVLVSQLGYKPNDARRMISEAIERNENIDSPEALFDEVYKGKKK